MQKPYVGAPYNFIDFPSKWVSRYDQISELPRHDRFYEGHHSGTIDFEWIAETPVMIGDGKKEGEFFRNQFGFAIPGNTVRGLIRSHIQILGCSNYRDDIENQRFLYRGIATKDSKLKEEYNTSIGVASGAKQVKQQEERKRMLPDKVKAGYIEKFQSDSHKPQYRIIPAQKDDLGNQYYEISEHRLRKMKLDNIREISYMYKKELWDKYHPQMDKTDLDKYKNGSGKDKSLHGKVYNPYRAKIQFSMKHDGSKIHKIEKPYPRKKEMSLGYLFNSGYISGKRVHYIIREPEEAVEGLVLPLDLTDSYDQDLTMKKFRGKKYEYYHLPKRNGKEGRKPIFYVEAGNHIYFGFTPHLRVFYDYDVHTGIPKEHQPVWKLDYNKSLFGFTVNKQCEDFQGYKSRLAFEDMNVAGEPDIIDPVTILPGEPKATAYPLYLKQPHAEKGRLSSYNDSQFELRGMKRYWLKNEEIPQPSKNPKFNSFMKPLNAGTKFSGKIRFTNLTDDELGLLLWALLLEEDCFFNVGKGKPYGYGRMRINSENLVLKIDNYEKKYGKTFTLMKDYRSSDDPYKYIKSYHNYMEKVNGICIREESHIQGFFRMCSNILQNNKVRYMNIGKKNEFRDLNPLTTVEETLEGKHRKYNK